jgi:adenylate cyclase
MQHANFIRAVAANRRNMNTSPTPATPATPDAFTPPGIARQFDERVHGSRTTLFWRELWGNAAHFPLANLFYELVMEGRELFTAPDAYVLIIAALVQARMASTWQHAGRPRPFLSNLVGPFIYLVLETLIEGPRFFAQPNHLIYLGFGLVIGSLQWAAARWPAPRVQTLLHLASGLSRGLILLLMYVALEYRVSGKSPWIFLNEQTHQYMALALLALGLLIGLHASQESRQRALVASVAEKLKRFSDWSLGRKLTELALDDDSALALHASDVGVLFIDLRGFTAWSDNRSPREVVDMLNDFYVRVERAVLLVAAPIRIKFTADEAMVVMSNASEALAAARAIRADTADYLKAIELGAGLGVHAGPAIKGMLGAGETRLFDVIGDTINVAKRLCDAAKAGEMIVSEAVAERLVDDERAGVTGEWVQMEVRGKAEGLRVCRA